MSILHFLTVSYN